MPASSWPVITRASAAPTSRSRAAASTGSPRSWRTRRSRSAGGRGRLPTWVLRIRDTLLSTDAPPAPPGRSRARSAALGAEPVARQRLLVAPVVGAARGTRVDEIVRVAQLAVAGAELAPRGVEPPEARADAGRVGGLHDAHVAAPRSPPVLDGPRHVDVGDRDLEPLARGQPRGGPRHEVPLEVAHQPPGVGVARHA